MKVSWEPLGLDTWPRVAIRPVLAVKVPDDRLRAAGLRLIEADDPGLGPVVSTGARLRSGHVFALNRHPWSPSPQDRVLEAEESEQLLSDINSVLLHLDVSPDELTWVSEKHKHPSFQVLRQDDNGNLFVVGTYSFEALAENVIRRLSAGGHKQMYWTAPAGGA